MPFAVKAANQFWLRLSVSGSRLHKFVSDPLLLLAFFFPDRTRHNLIPSGHLVKALPWLFPLFEDATVAVKAALSLTLPTVPVLNYR